MLAHYSSLFGASGIFFSTTSTMFRPLEAFFCWDSYVEQTLCVERALFIYLAVTLNHVHVECLSDWEAAYQHYSFDHNNFNNIIYNTMGAFYNFYLLLLQFWVLRTACADMLASIAHCSKKHTHNTQGNNSKVSESYFYYSK